MSAVATAPAERTVVAKPVPANIAAAVRCGPLPADLHAWRTKAIDDMTDGEKIVRFAHDYLAVPEGPRAGQPLELTDYQIAFLLSLQRTNILSLGRRAGKTLIAGVLVNAALVGPLARTSGRIASAAMALDQAALVYRAASLMLQLSPRVPRTLYRCVPSTKQIFGINRGVEYSALARGSKSGLGRGYDLVIIDEAGQIEAESDDFIDALLSSQTPGGDNRVVIISTQAPTDNAYLSREIDAAIQHRPADTTLHLYTALTDDISDPANWRAANPSIDAGVRSLEDVAKLAREAAMIPGKQPSFLNLVANRRVMRDQLAFAPLAWKSCGGEIDIEVFRRGPCHLGLDLGARLDLTGACLAAEDTDGTIHLLPFAYAPVEGVRERSVRDKTPYDRWADEEHLTLTPGKATDFEFVFGDLKQRLADLGVSVDTIQFDAWRIDEARAAAERAGFTGPTWCEVRQGWRTWGPLIDFFESRLIDGKIRHPNHPPLNLGAATAAVLTDPTGARKLTKAIGSSKHARRIDVLVAAVQACVPFIRTPEAPSDMSWSMIL